jgi:hypothetical protein
MQNLRLETYAAFGVAVQPGRWASDATWSHTIFHNAWKSA